MADYGGGIYLTQADQLEPNWDMEVDETGDIRTVTGEDELLKDVAYATAVRLQPEFGSPITPVVLNRVRARVRDTLEDEDRIQNIINIDVDQIDTNTVEVVARAISDEGDIELVFGAEL